MKIENLLYILEIAKSESISKAARKLYVTQPALSIIVQNLEEEFGFSIFNRTPWGVKLTEEGKRLVGHIEDIEKNMNCIMRISQSKPQKFKVNVAAIPICCSNIIIELIDASSDAFPDVELRVSELRHQKVIDAIVSNEAVIALGSYTPASKPKIMSSAEKWGITIEHVIDDRIVAYLHGKHRLALESGISISELGDDTPIFFYDSAPVMEEEQGMSSGASGKSFEFSDRASINKAISRGMGYALLPYSLAIDDIYVQTGVISVVPVRDVDIPVGIFLAYRDSELQPRERDVLGIMRERCRIMADKIEKKLSPGQEHTDNEPNLDVKIWY